MFNLITDAWVPVTYRDGHRALVGLRQLMVDAEAISPQLDIPDASVARAIERLLIAVVYQATKPTVWAALWQSQWSLTFEVRKRPQGYGHVRRRSPRRNGA